MEFIKSSYFDCEQLIHAHKKREVGLLLLGSFSEDIIDFLYKHSSFDIIAFIKRLIADIKLFNDKQVIIARTLWCLSKFSEIIAAKNSVLFFELFKASSQYISKQNHIFLRLTAIKVLGMLKIYINLKTHITFFYQIHQ